MNNFFNFLLLVFEAKPTKLKATIFLSISLFLCLTSQFKEVARSDILSENSNLTSSGSTRGARRSPSNEAHGLRPSARDPQAKLVDKGWTRTKK